MRAFRSSFHTPISHSRRSLGQYQRNGPRGEARLLPATRAYGRERGPNRTMAARRASRLRMPRRMPVILEERVVRGEESYVLYG